MQGTWLGAVYVMMNSMERFLTSLLSHCTPEAVPESCPRNSPSVTDYNDKLLVELIVSFDP